MEPREAITILSNMLAIQFLLPFGSLGGGLGQTVAAALPSITQAVKGSTWLVAWSLSWIAMIALLYSMFKLLLKLIGNLLSIIFLTIAAPFYFLAASLPGRQGLATVWMFNMLCNVLAFPAVFAVFYFVAFILAGHTSHGDEFLFKVPSGTPLTTSTTFPLLGGIDTSFLNRLLAFGALMALPAVPDIICRTVGKPNQLGALAAGAIGGAIASGQKYQGQVSGGGSGFAQNMGRLTDQHGMTLAFNPSSGKVEELPTIQAGQISRARKGIKSIPANLNKLGNWLNNPLGRGGSGHSGGGTTDTEELV